MATTGHVKEGVIVLDDPVVLPDEATVWIRLLDATDDESESGELTLHLPRVELRILFA